MNSVVQPARRSFTIKKTDAPHAARGFAIPRDYQQIALDLYKDHLSIFLAMEMRLGKTLTVIWWLRRHQARTIFIFAPKTVLISWEDDLRRENVRFHSLVEQPNDIRVDIIRSASDGYYLLNYEALLNPQIESAIASRKPDAIVLDESTVIKRATSKTAKALLRLSSCAKFKACLSGLPAPENWWDIWSQMAFLNNGTWMGSDNFYKWQERNTIRDPLGHGFHITPQQAKAIKETYHSQAYCLSRQAAGIGEKKIYQSLGDYLEPRLRRLYEEIDRSWSVPGLEIDKTQDETQYRFVVDSWLHRLCGGHLPRQSFDTWKYRETLHTLQDLRARHEPAVVWFRYNEEIAHLKEYVRAHDKSKSLHRSIATLTGDDSISVRREIVHRFQTGAIDYLFIQQRIGRFGLNLSRADVAIYFSNYYDNELRVQSEDRIVMPGKPRPLLYIDLVTKGTLEEEQINALRYKKLDSKSLTHLGKLGLH